METVVTVLEVCGNRVRLGIDAPDDTMVSRAALNEFWLPIPDDGGFAMAR